MHSYLDALLQGAYHFERYVSSPVLQMTGKATFEKMTFSKRAYYEQGSYPLGGSCQSYYQKRFFTFNAATLEIHKEDGSLLHTFSLPSQMTYPLTLHHTHVCKKDRYEGCLIFWGPRHFEMRYDISGPHKNYRIHTSFRGIDD